MFYRWSLVFLVCICYYLDTFWINLQSKTAGTSLCVFAISKEQMMLNSSFPHIINALCYITNSSIRQRQYVAGFASAKTQGTDFSLGLKFPSVLSQLLCAWECVWNPRRWSIFVPVMVAIPNSLTQCTFLCVLQSWHPGNHLGGNKPEAQG